MSGSYPYRLGGDLQERQEYPLQVKYTKCRVSAVMDIY